MLLERSHAERLRGVVAGVEHVQPQLLSVEVRVVRPLARDERVEPRGRGLSDHRAGRARDDPHAPHLPRTERHHAGDDAEHRGNPFLEGLPRAHQFSLHADRDAVMLAEGATLSDAQLSRQHDVVPDLGVEIERNVRAVEGDVVSDEAGDAPVGRPREGTEATPEEPVMHQQEVGPLLRRQLHGRFAQVDRSGQARHFACVLDLQAVQRLRSVRDVSNAQIAVEVPDQVGEQHQPV